MIICLLSERNQKQKGKQINCMAVNVKTETISYSWRHATKRRKENRTHIVDRMIFAFIKRKQVIKCNQKCK